MDNQSINASMAHKLSGNQQITMYTWGGYNTRGHIHHFFIVYFCVHLSGIRISHKRRTFKLSRAKLVCSKLFRDRVWLYFTWYMISKLLLNEHLGLVYTILDYFHAGHIPESGTKNASEYESSHEAWKTA